jgi:hypothetical protein
MTDKKDQPNEAKTAKKTPSTSETGHAKNVANLEQLLSYIGGYGETYNPPKPSISLESMKRLALDANKAVNAVNVALPSLSLAIAAREVAFGPLSKLVTRVLSSLKATGTSEQVDKSATAIARKIVGTRATAKKTEEQKAALAAEGKVMKEVSTSQMSFDSRLNNFDSLISFVASVPEYKPNEEDLKVTSLTAYHKQLKEKNTAVANASVTVSNARIARNEILYKPLTGLVDVAFDAKLYIKSLYGSTSPQFKQVSGIEFKTVK